MYLAVSPGDHKLHSFSLFVEVENEGGMYAMHDTFRDFY